MLLNEVGAGSLVLNVDTGDDCCIPVLSRWKCGEKQSKPNFFIVLSRGRIDCRFSQYQDWQLHLYLALQPKLKFAVAIKHPPKSLFLNDISSLRVHLCKKSFYTKSLNVTPESSIRHCWQKEQLSPCSLTTYSEILLRWFLFNLMIFVFKKHSPCTRSHCKMSFGSQFLATVHWKFWNDYMNINFRWAGISTASKAKREKEKMRECGTSPQRPALIHIN